MAHHKAICLALLTICHSAIASEYAPKGPLTLRNQNPIYLQFLNIEPTRAVTLKHREFAFRIDNAYSNTYEHGLSSTNEEIFDMESLRTALHFNYGVYDEMEIGIEIPFLRFDTGFLEIGRASCRERV